MKKFIIFLLAIFMFSPCLMATNYALYFDGYDDFAEILNNNNSLTLQQMTISLWAKPDAGSGIRPALYKNSNRASNYDNYDINVGDNGAVRFHVEESVGDADYSVYSTTLASSNEWIHISGVFTGTQLKIYINGDLENTYTSNTVNLYNGPENLFLGTSRFSNHGGYAVGEPLGTSYKGLLDEVRVWNIVRTDEQIAQDYNDPIDPNIAGLVGYWNFDEDANSQSIFDLTGNGNHGTLGSSNLSGGDDPIRVEALTPLSNVIPEPSTILLLVIACLYGLKFGSAP